MFNEFPYTDLHNLNLDWFLEQFHALKTLVNNMEAMLTALQSLPDASGASDGQVLTADGNGGWQWEDPQSGGGSDIPDSVKQAINTVLQNVAFDDNQTYTAELAIIQAWVNSIDSVTLSANSGSAVIGNTITITAITTGTGTLQAVSSDTGVATVAVNGNTITITAVAAGSATITVTYGTASATYSATVTAQPATLVSISAVYTQGGTTVYDTDSLDVLKPDLVVTATYSDSTTAVIASSDYTLSGTLTVGTSTITVSYGGQTDTFTVTVTQSVVDTTAQIDRDGYIGYYSSYSSLGSKCVYVAQENAGVTIAYELDEATTQFSFAGIIPYADGVLEGTSVGGAIQIASLFALDSDGNHADHVNEYASAGRWAQDVSGTLVEYSRTGTANTAFKKIFVSVDTRYVDDAYLYHVPTGKVFFAGVNTPYYGMSNISEA